MSRVGSLAALGVCTALAACSSVRAPSPSFVTRNDLRVYDLPDGRFEVIAGAGTAGPGYFCAAGDYARLMRNARAADRVSISAPDGPSALLPGARSVVFEILPPGPRTLPAVTLLPMGRTGASLPVAGAQAVCRTGPNKGHWLD